MRNKVVEVRRQGHRLVTIKIILNGQIINTISVYTPLVGLDKTTKKKRLLGLS